MYKIVSIALGSAILATAFVSSAEAAEGWARSSSRLRAGPGASYPAITRVVAGEALDVHGCLRNWSWCDVSTDDARGWFPGSRIALARDGRRVALPGVATLFGLGIVGFERDVYWRDHYRDRPFYERHYRDRPGYGRPDRDRPFHGRPDHDGRRYDPDTPRGEPPRAGPPRFEPPPPRVEAPPRGDVHGPRHEGRPPRGEPTAPRPPRFDQGGAGPARPPAPPATAPAQPPQPQPACPPGAAACR